MLIKRTSTSGSNDLNTIYRPRTIDELHGNITIKAMLSNYLKTSTLPHTLLLTGPAGCGKTTAARIIALSLNCEAKDKPCLKCPSCISILNGTNLDVVEINIGKSGGKDDTSSMVKDLAYAPYNSKFKVIILDEAHELTMAAKDLLLKEIEDGYKHVYFIFCTNQPEKLKGKVNPDPFISRCTTFKFNKLSESELIDLLSNVAEFEGMPFTKEAISLIASGSEGCPRQALVYLSQVSNEGSWSLTAINSILIGIASEEDTQVIELCRLLANGDWPSVIGCYDKIKTTMAVESIRLVIAGYFLSCLKKCKTTHAAIKFDKVLDLINIPIYDTGKVADTKLVHTLFKITMTMEGTK